MTEAGWTGNKVTAECIRDTLREQGNVLSPHVVAQCIDDLLKTDSFQQGRVDGLRECLDMLEGEIARDRDSGVLESLRQRMEAKLEECK